jgi:hypothetical protein
MPGTEPNDDDVKNAMKLKKDGAEEKVSHFSHQHTASLQSCADDWFPSPGPVHGVDFKVNRDGLGAFEGLLIIRMVRNTSLTGF